MSDSSDREFISAETERALDSMLDKSGAIMPQPGSQVDTPCWTWRKLLRSGAYPSIRTREFGGIRAHRLALMIKLKREIARDSEGKTLHVLHACGNSLCCNPDHLYEGTHIDNARDRSRHGRTASGERHGLRIHPDRIQHGEAHGNARLRLNDVLFIRQQRHKTDAQLSEQFSVTVGHIRKIRAGERWQRSLSPKTPSMCPLGSMPKTSLKSERRTLLTHDCLDSTPKRSRAQQIEEMLNVVENVDRVVDRINKKVGDIIPLLERQEQRLATKVQRAVRLLDDSKHLSPANFKREDDKLKRRESHVSHMHPPTQKRHKTVLALVPRVREVMRQSGVNKLCRVIACLPNDSFHDIREAFFLAVRDDLVNDTDRHGTRCEIRPEWDSRDVEAAWDTFNRDRTQTWWDVALILRISVILVRSVIICRLREEVRSASK